MGGGSSALLLHIGGKEGATAKSICALHVLSGAGEGNCTNSGFAYLPGYAGIFARM
jgi:hypothetical protein